MGGRRTPTWRSSVVDLQLVLVRTLLDRAIEAHREGSDLGQMNAMLLADVAVETLTKASCRRCRIQSKGNLADLLTKLEARLPDLVGRVELADAVSLRHARNTVQHDGHAPSSANVDQWIRVAVAFSELLGKSVFGRSFLTVTTADLVRDPTFAPKLSEAMQARRRGDLSSALVTCVGIFEAMRIRWTKAVRLAGGLGPEKVEFLPATVSPAVITTYPDRSDLAFEPKLLEDKYGPVALMNMGFSIHELIRLRRFKDLVDDAARKQHSSQKPIDLTIDVDEFDAALESIARQLWRLEATQPEVFGPSALELDKIEVGVSPG